MRKLAQAIAFFFAMVGGTWCFAGPIALFAARERGVDWMKQGVDGKTMALCILMAFPGVLLVLAGFWIQRGLKPIAPPRGFAPVLKPAASAAAPRPDVKTADDDPAGVGD
ncbi:MAG TPA: hypothetical protein VIL86_16355 [Tepidisphaeraceae bacterium]